MNYSAEFESIRNDVSAQEWPTRIDLACDPVADWRPDADYCINVSGCGYPPHRH